MLSNARAGDLVVVTELWRGRLWSAVPHRLVEASSDRCVTWLPAGTLAAWASGRGLPECAGLTRSQRKHATMSTLRYRTREIAVTPSTLQVFTAGRWSRITLGWDADGTFLGWYVNFELPPTESRHTAVPELATMDLVLDMYVHPDGSSVWKDRDDFDRALADGLFEPALASTLAAEAETVLADWAAQTGAFDQRWRLFRPPAGWSTPELPPEYRAGSRRWDGALP